MSHDGSRFADVSRRAFMKRSMAAGLGAAATIGLAACGSKGDKAVFSSATTTGGSAGAGTTAAAATATTARAATTATTARAGTTATTTAPAGTTGSTAPAGPALPAGAELRVAFTFAAGSGGFGPAKNPFIAVWLEDAAGEMVQVISLWIEQGGKGQRYWNELPRWYREDAKRVAAGGAATATTITGATRTPGDYTVAWKGDRLGGAKATQGTYFLCIEAAREHGPYELIREQLTIGAKAFEQKLTPNGELTAASASYVVA